jgi:hypothetical protein
MQNTLPSYPDSIAALVAIVRAAERGGDPRLAKAARRELREKHGIRLDRASIEKMEASPCK